MKITCDCGREVEVNIKPKEQELPAESRQDAANTPKCEKTSDYLSKEREYIDGGRAGYIGL